MYKLKQVTEQVTTASAANLAGAYFTAKRYKKTRTFNPIFEEITGKEINFRKSADPKHHANQPKFEREMLLTMFKEVSQTQADEIIIEFQNKLEDNLKEALSHSISKCLNAANLISQPAPKQEYKKPVLVSEDDNLFFQPEIREREEQPQQQPVKIITKQLVKEGLSEVKANGSLKGNFNFQFPIMAAVEEAVNQYFEKNPIQAPEAREQEAKTVIKLNDIKISEVKGQLHKDFKKALLILRATGKLFLKGEAGTGKGTLTRQLAEALNLKHGQISLTAGISEGYIIGRLMLDASFLSTAFIDCYENGGVFLFDEVDAADSNTLLVVNDAIASGSLQLPNRKENPTAKRHKDFYCICAANTWGTGNASIYHGREYLDGAFLDRFSVSKVALDYDEELERKLSHQHPEIAEKFQAIRAKIRANKILRTCSTRAIEDGVKLRLAGASMELILNIFFTGWDDAEINKVK